jgi:hypothetical protein
MKRIVIYSLIFWFWFNPYRALTWFSNCWLETTAQCKDCKAIDLNNDGIVNFTDYAILVQE